MFQNIIILISVLMLLAIICQWLGWFFRLPALVLLSGCGILLGPVFGVFNPEQTFGESLEYFISLGVGIILFEGGLQLKFAELRKNPKSILRMIFPGAFISWIILSISAHFIADFSWGVSIFIGGLLVVTGPTVIIPMLRQAKPSAKTASVLKWEGIINDPIGALMATITVLYLSHQYFQDNVIAHGAMITGAIIAIIFISLLIGKIIEFMFKQGRIAEYLKPSVLLAFVIIAYAIGNLLQKEGGLVAVTVLGVFLANTKNMRQEDIHKFIENLTLILVSLIFIILTATLSISDLQKINYQMILFVLALVFILRPLSVIISTINTELSFEEKLFIGLIGPRGVVCVAVAGLFAPMLLKAGYEDAKLLIPCIFLIVFTTVIFSGFFIKPLGKVLGVITPHENELLIVGASKFSISLAITLKDNNIPVQIIDHTWRRLKAARLAELNVKYGEVLSSQAEHLFDFEDVTHVLATSGNSAYNSLVCSSFAHELGEKNVLQLAPENGEQETWSYNEDFKGKTLVSNEWCFDKLQEMLNNDWQFISTRLTEKFDYEEYKAVHKEAIPIMKISEKGIFTFATTSIELAPKAGDLIIALKN